MAPRFAAAMLAGILILAAAVVARQQRGGQGAPGTSTTILSVVVEVGPATVRVLSAATVRGVVRPVDQAALANAPSGGHHQLVEYKAFSKGAPGGAPLFTSVFHVSFEPIHEDRPGQEQKDVASKPGQMATIAIALPDLPADTVMSFARLTPVPGAPSDKWDRTPMGQASLPPVRR
jgi:hypothetical protein